jgi:hypothetical protein
MEHGHVPVDLDHTRNARLVELGRDGARPGLERVRDLDAADEGKEVMKTKKSPTKTSPTKTSPTKTCLWCKRKGVGGFKKYSMEGSSLGLSWECRSKRACKKCEHERQP